MGGSSELYHLHARGHRDLVRARAVASARQAALSARRWIAVLLALLALQLISHFA
jgi:hypothetical protein